MFKLILITFIFSINLGFAQTLSDCTGAASFYGHDFQTAAIDDNCKSVVINNTDELTSDFTEDNYIQAFGSGNIIHVLYYVADINGNPVLTESGLTSGKYTLLNNIKAIEIDEVGVQVFALNEAVDSSLNIVSVNADISGHLSAITRLITSDLQGAVNLKTDRANNDLFVVGADWVKVFNVQAHDQSNIPERSLAVKRNVSGNNTSFLDIKDIAVSATEIFVLDSDRILSFTRTADGDLIPAKNISGANTTMSGAKAIDFNSTDGLLHITNGDDQVIKFNTTDNGDLAPL